MAVQTENPETGAYDPETTRLRPIGNRNSSASNFQDELDSVSAKDQKALRESEELERMYGLEGVSPEEMDYASQLDEQKNLDRGSRTEALKDRTREAAKNLAIKEAKVVGKKVVKRALAEAIVATSPYWGPVLAVLAGIALIFCIFIFIIVSIAQSCQQEGIKGFVVRTVSTGLSAIGYTEDDLCKQFADTGQASPRPEASTTSATNAPTDLVAITGVPSTASDSRLRPCMLEHVQSIYAKAQARGLNIRVSSAYRPGALVAGTNRLSAHARGEAVDLVLVPPGNLSDRAFQDKITLLVSLVLSEGFKEPQGNTLDEYNKPTDGATGPHVHGEFNLAANGGSYCQPTK